MIDGEKRTCNKCGKEMPKDQEWCLEFNEFGNFCGGEVTDNEIN